MSYRRVRKEKESDELSYTGSVARYGPRNQLPAPTGVNQRRVRRTRAVLVSRYRSVSTIEREPITEAKTNSGE